MKKNHQKTKVEAPLTVSTIGLVRSKDGWQAVRVTIVDGKITLIERSEPDVRAVANEKFRIWAAPILTGEAT